jgi:TRAP-type C4-dicarboxylate transport system substrate-binding protein
MTITRLRSFLVVALSAAVALVAMGTGTAQAGERRIASLAPAGSAWMNILEEGARKLGQATEGRVKVKWYPGGTQGDEKDVVRKIKLKQLDGSALTTVGLSLIYPGIRVLQLPFLFDSVGEVDYVRKKMWPYFQRKFKAKGFRLQYPGDVGWTYLYSNTALSKMSDIKKVKFWAWTDDPIVRAFFKKLGVSSVPLGVPEVLSALKTGRINGCYGSPLAAVALQWYTEVTHATSEPVAYGVGGMVIRLDIWEGLSEADQKIEKKIGRKIGKKLVKRVRKDNKRAKKAMQKDGIKFVNTPAALKTKLQAQAEKVWAELAGDVYTKDELEMALKYRDEYRAQQK